MLTCPRTSSILKWEQMRDITSAVARYSLTQVHIIYCAVQNHPRKSLSPNTANTDRETQECQMKVWPRKEEDDLVRPLLNGEGIAWVAGIVKVCERCLPGE
jgi:hypothetical protein